MKRDELIARVGEELAVLAERMYLQGYRYLCLTQDKLTHTRDYFFAKNAMSVGPILREVYPNSVAHPILLNKVEW